MVLEKEVIKPYPYQLPVISTVKATLAIRDFALFVMAMGLGKTVTSAFIVEDWLREGKRGLFLCHENYILEQVEDEYRKVLGNDLVYKTFYGSEANGKKDWTADQADMLFAGFQALNNWHEKWYLAFDRNHFDFMVVDESHHGQAPTYKEVIDYFQCKKIGMTATPDRMDLKDIREIFGEEVYTINLEDGIANGWLADIEYHVLSDGINNAKLKKICKEVLEEGKRVSIKQLNETIFIHDRDKAEKEIIHEYSIIKNHSGDKKTLLFCERTKHADNLISHFGKQGMAMHSKKKPKENDAAFTAFKDGKLQYVSSVNKFNEGKHVPGVEVIAALRSTNSLTTFWQQLGRALAKTNGKEKIIYLDFVSNLDRLIMVRDLMLRIKKKKEELMEMNIKLKRPLDESTMNLSGEGFSFIFSDELVDIVKVIEALRKGYYETWEEASVAAKKLGFMSSFDYQQGFRQDLRLYSFPRKIYPDFPGWSEFLGKEVAEIGWRCAKQILPTIGLSYILPVTNFVEEYCKDKSNLIKQYWGKGAYVDYYHPKLVKVIIQKLKVVEGPPEGWRSAQILSHDCSGVTRATIKKYVEQFRKDHSDWFKICASQNNQPSTYYHPELCQKIEQFVSCQKIEEGWVTINSVAGLLNGTTRQKVKSFAETFLHDHPEWFKKLPNNQGYYIHSDLRIIIGKHFKSYEHSPEGWMTATALYEKQGISSEVTIKSFVTKFRISHPEWFKFYMSGSNVCECYHPDLVSLIKTKLGNRESAPEGWKTTTGIKKAGIATIESARKFAENFRLLKPEWFREFYSKGQLVEHYHPELVEKIKERYTK